MREAKVTVSVVMPVYNGERYLEAAVRSVMAQTFGDWELIIVDDGSTDGTPAIAARLAAEDPRIRLVKNIENRGVAASRNRGLALCGGEYVALLDGDDLWRPDKLRRQLALAQRTGADIVYCSYGMINDRGKPCCRDFIVPEETDLEASLVKSVISCSTALLRRETVGAYRFPVGYMHEDLALWLGMLRDGCRAAGTTEVLADYRVTGRGRAANKLRCARGRWEIYRHMLGYSVFRSGKLLLRYGILGLKKYRRVGRSGSNDRRSSAGAASAFGGV